MTAVLLAGWLSLALEGCAGRQAPQKRYLRIGVVMYDVNDTFLSELIACFREDAKSLQTEERSINVTVRDGEKSQRTEDSCVEELIDGGCDVLCVNLVDRTAPSRIIDMAMERDIPIIFFNREPVKEDLAQWDRMYYVGSDPEESGVMQGELAADYIRNFDPDEREMRKFTIGAFGMVDTPLTASMAGDRSMSAYMSGRKLQDLQEIRDQMLAVTPEVIRGLADAAQTVAESGNICVIGSQSAVMAQKEMFDTIRPLIWQPKEKER